MDYVVVGSVASSFHGEPRGTQDIDIVARILRSDVSKLAREFPEQDFYFDRDMVLDSIRSRQPFNIIDLRSMWKADIILPSEPYTNEQLARRQRVELAGVPVYVATAEDTVVSKMRWSKLAESDRQLNDVAGIIRVRGAALDRALISALVSRFGLEAEWARALQIAAT
ncbi:MAG: hypothetical protein V4850_21150 [Myxococcota bacterium]